eukprot:CAMPEP_0119387320 /NCGR_PEP_ID=MMETSP1334-20130426/100123_1 /TAXON_ID=127549 /ORGANISM="Calcidiscus leptoporus, Strain RCC1130" /LENGTH=133 /DNA_ID=CAMNT_0007409023 /DNA_START=1 /DNA_END=402 /DNA_ORIENTATION=-
MVVQDHAALAEDGPWRGFDSVARLVLVSHVLGGLLVGLTVKVADSVVKTFAVGIALVISCIGSAILFGSSLAQQFVVGVSLVVMATVVYALQPIPERCCVGAVQPVSVIEEHLSPLKQPVEDRTGVDSGEGSS